MPVKSIRRYTAAKWLLPIAAVVLIVLTVLLMSLRRQTVSRSLSPVDGVVDITGEDLSDEVINIVNSWDFYPNKLYSPEDFALGVDDELSPDGQDDESGCIKYGTYRVIIKAQPRQYYTLCSYSIDYSTLVYVNGTEVYAFGEVADNASESVPMIGYMTIPLYSGESGEIEIIYQYSNFVHKDGGFIQPTYLSTPQNMEEFKAGNDFASLALSGGMLVLFLFFILCASIQRSLDYFLLALCCLVMAMRDQNFLILHALPPDTSWFFTYRLFIAVSTLLPCMPMLLICSLYRLTVKRLPVMLYAATMVASIVLIAVLPTTELVTVCTAEWVISVPFLIYPVCCIIRYYRKTGTFGYADGLNMLGFALIVVTILIEGLLVNNSSAVSRYGVVPSGMLIFVLLTAVSISLRARDRQTALAESRSREKLLEQMNALHMDFLHQIAHELKTPLTVISGYAQLTGLQFAANSMNEGTSDNLKTIHHEAKRLANMVTNLMDYSDGHQSEIEFTTVEVAPLLKSVNAIYAPMCAKNGNRIYLRGMKCADVYGNSEMLLQVFINLVTNANRHMKDGVVTVSASDAENPKYVVFRVEDMGSGISPELLPHIFEKGFSGDGGSGLGLAICLRAVEAHGGSMSVERTGPEGTVFAFTVLRKEP